MFIIKSTGMAGRAITTDREGGTDRRADQATGRIIMATDAGVVGFRRGTIKSVIMTARTTGCPHLNDWTVIGHRGRMHCLPGASVTDTTLAPSETTN